MSKRFYVSGPLAPGPVHLQGSEAHHLATVCRLRPGDRVCLFNGGGHEYPAVLEAVSRQGVALEVLAVESPARELGVRLEVASPVPKGDRAQFLIEKLTELGVTRFVPLRTRRSVVPAGKTKRDKLQRYVIEASKQCERNVLLAIEPLAAWESYCKRVALPRARVLAHPGGASDLPPAGCNLAVAVGPEGGFTEEEVAAGRQAGWHVIDLGPRTLRVETAALLLAAWAIRRG